MLHTGKQISNSWNLFTMHNADHITTEKQSWNAIMEWSVIIAIAQWLDIFSSEISRLLNLKNITASFSQSSKNIFATIRCWFIFLPVNLCAGAIAPLAGSFEDEVINFGNLASRWELSRAEVGNYLDFKPSLVHLAEFNIPRRMNASLLMC